MERKEIYIVDDSDDYRFLIQQVFNKFLPQYFVRFFSGGEIVLKQLLLLEEGSVDKPPSLILMDLNMPEMSGYQTLKQIKDPVNEDFNFVSLIPIVMMSNDETPDEVSACYGAGANAFLKKPIEFEHLKELLNSVCYFWLQINQVPELIGR